MQVKLWEIWMDVYGMWLHSIVKHKTQYARCVNVDNSRHIDIWYIFPSGFLSCLNWIIIEGNDTMYGPLCIHIDWFPRKPLCFHLWIALRPLC